MPNNTKKKTTGKKKTPPKKSRKSSDKSLRQARTVIQPHVGNKKNNGKIRQPSELQAENCDNIGGPHRFKKGEVHNPKGRPKGQTLTPLLRKYLNERATWVPSVKIRAVELGYDPHSATVGDVLALSILDDVICGKVHPGIVGEIFNRVDGKQVDAKMDIPFDPEKARDFLCGNDSVEEVEDE